MADVHSQLRDALSDRYRLQHKVGEGGMATVYLAQDLKHDRPVALKLLHPELAQSLGAERFTREVRVAARLQHPHILTVLDSGESEGLLWFTMPFVEGESLRDRMRRERQLQVADAVRIVREAALALDYAHRHGIVHRDVKPENILLADGQALVADFGIARALGGGESITGTGMVVGTPAYMSPEQASGESIDARTDIYSLGCVLYEMLAGEPPFTGPTAMAVISKRMATDAPSLAVVRPGVNSAVAEATAKALQRAPADRFANAADFAQSLERAVSGALEPTAARHASAAALPVVLVAAPAKRVGRGVLAALGLLLGVGALFAWRKNAASGDAPAAGAAAMVAASDHRVAVLPFENLGDSADAYFADGMTDAVRGKLAELTGVQVIARASSQQYRHATKTPAEIAKELGVTYLLTGAVRWARSPGSGVASSRVQVSPELVEISEDGTPQVRWNKAVDADLADVFKVQGEIAEKVVGAMSVALGSADQARIRSVPVANAAAYDAYLRGEAAWNGGVSLDPPALRRAIAYFEQAIARDSTIPDWWASLARAYAHLSFNSVRNPEFARKSRAAAERALALDPHNAAGHQALGAYYRGVLSDFPRGLAEYEAAARAAPGDGVLAAGVANAKADLGRFEEAVADFRRAASLDPRSPLIHTQLAHILLRMRRYGEARAVVGRAVALAPTSLFSIQYRTMVEMGSGDLTRARQLLASAARDVDPAALAAYMANYWDIGWVLDDAGQQLALRLGKEAYDDDAASWSIVRAQLHRWRGDTLQARVWADSARVHFAEQIRSAPDDAQLHAFLGLSLAYLGRRGDAIREGERGVALSPTSKDALGGPYYEHILARTYLLLGKHDKALDLLERLLSVPYFLSPGWLRIDPTWAPLKGNPRFERLIATP